MTDRRSWKVLGRLIRWNSRRTMTCYFFFPDFSPATAAKRKSLVPVLRSMTALGLQHFLAYPAVIKLRHGVSREVSTLFGRRRILSALCHRRGHLLRLHKAAGRRRPPSLRPGGRGLMAWIEEMPAARKKMVAGGPPPFSSFPLLLGYCSYLFDTIVSLLVRLPTSPPLFYFFLLLSGGD